MTRQDGMEWTEMGSAYKGLAFAMGRKRGRLGALWYAPLTSAAGACFSTSAMASRWWSVRKMTISQVTQNFKVT